MDRFLERYNLEKSTQKETEQLSNSLMLSKEIQFVTRKLKVKREGFPMGLALSSLNTIHLGTSLPVAARPLRVGG